MADILEYLLWRGDLPFSVSPFNEVDNLILAELAYPRFIGILPGLEEGGSLPLHQAAERYFAANPKGETSLGLLLSERILDLLEQAAESVRFRDLPLGCYVDILDHGRSVQFAALTAELPDGSVYLAYRGTDDSLTGWREDFEMSFLDKVPAQEEALRYLEAVARRYRRRALRLGGHSKGGNLAVYAAVSCTPATRRRIREVYNNDGPGFRQPLPRGKGADDISGRVSTILPDSSVVGLLMSHEEDYTVVKSSQTGLLQHDGFSWEVLGPSFVHLSPDEPALRRNDRTLKEWVAGMDDGQRRRFTEGLFQILSSTEAETLRDLAADSFKTASAILRAMADLDAPTREALAYVVKLLFHTQFKVLAEELREAEPLKKLGRKKK